MDESEHILSCSDSYLMLEEVQGILDFICGCYSTATASACVSSHRIFQVAPLVKPLYLETIAWSLCHFMQSCVSQYITLNPKP